MSNSSHHRTLHLWFPNLFEFKGGIQVYLQDVLFALEKNSTDQHFFVFDKLDRDKPSHLFGSKQFSFILSGQVPPLWRTPYFAWTLARAALTQRPSLILCGHLNFAPVAFWLYRLLGIPYWILVYGVDAWNVKNPLKVQALHAAEKIISISDYTRMRLIDEQKIAADKIPILPVTFDVSRWSLGTKPVHLLERYGLKPNQPVILTVTRLSDEDRYKGYDQIIQALPEIQKSLPNVHYLLVGKGNDRPRIEALIRSLQLEDCVTLTGFIPDQELCDHYNLCDVFAMPSKGEGFGIVYLEALACGKPVLGGNQDGAIDALAHGELGVLVNPDDLDAIAHTLTQILQKTYPHPLLYQPKQLRQKVVDYFGFDRFQETLATLLTQHFESTTPSNHSS